jgi:NSS family neurotransmitter:Na+ symporter
MAVANLVGDLRHNYGDYPGDALIIFGWSAAAAVLVLSFLFQSMKSKWPEKISTNPGSKEQMR